MKEIQGMKIVKDIVRVSVSNIAKLLSGVLVGFLLPKILGVSDYGYYKTFTLYATYVGLFHLGMSDGIYLKYGGRNYDELEKCEFRFFTRVFWGLEIFIAGILIIVSSVVLDNEYRFIFICLAAYLVFNNATSYYQMISQITGRFKELSIRNVLQALVIVLIILLLWILQKTAGFNVNYREYIFLYILTMVVLTFWYIRTYKDITFGRIDKRWRQIPVFIRIGFPLTIANLCSSLILTLDRQFVNVLFDTETYAVYAFAYNLLSLVTTATSAISVVLYPKLKRTGLKELDSMYHILIGLVLGLVFGGLIIYFPLCIFVEWFLPKYSLSLAIFRVIFPGLAISSAITIVMHNYYKTINANNRFFVKTIWVLGISCVANIMSYVLYRTTISISIASIFTMIVWYIIVEAYLIKHRNIKWRRNFVYMVVMILAFYISTSIANYYISMAIYGGAFITISILVYGKLLKQYILNK